MIQVGINFPGGDFRVTDMKAAVVTIFQDESYRTHYGNIGSSLRAAGGYRQAVSKILDFKEQNGISG